MPMIRCPECDGVVSDRLSKCPHCGKQIPMSARYPQFYNNETTENHSNSNCSQSKNLYTPHNTPAETQQNNYVSQVKVEHKTMCPRCGGTNITFQREQTVSFGAGTNKVVIQPAKKSKGCLYWMIIGFWWEPIYFLLIGWWFRPLFGGRTKSGLNFNANKSINKTMAVCQSCGNSWKVK